MADEPFPIELRAAGVADFSCNHFWNHLEDKPCCAICLSNFVAQQALKNESYRAYRAFYRRINPPVSKEQLAQLERESGPKIMIAFKLTGKRGKVFSVGFSPSNLPEGGIFVELFEGHFKALDERKAIAAGIVATVEFSALTALLPGKGD